MSPHYPGVSLIIPAYNEAKSLPDLLPQLAPFGLGQLIVADNGSTDDTGDIARALGATVVHEPRKGYGAACWAGMAAISDPCEVVVFLDADLADDPALLPQLVDPVLDGSHDLVIGVRPRGLRERGSMTPQQHFGNWLATTLIRLFWGYRYTDLGPFRAIGRSALDRIGMRDRAYGWTIEMQIRALDLRLRILQVDVPYRRRIGVSKISGTLRGTCLAGYWILRTLGVLAWRRLF